MNKLAIPLAALLLIGCQTAPVKPAPVEIIQAQIKYDASKISWVYKEGTGKVSGQAFLRTMSGNVKTCAGLRVLLVPVSDYSSERMSVIYGATDKGYKPYSQANAPLEPISKDFVATFRNTNCNAQGEFSFSGLPVGSYFVLADVLWKVRVSEGFEGGTLLQKVTIEHGKDKKILMSL